ncbi:SPL family radical SAM protein [Saliterribacillus persicus]|uniref:Radical SAM family protein n=1 Tax=Saliterribacillus persicus TaxID=930114 RepID=A0A368X832_9BACI|nr:radical SAM protein [Saliterribacillus persicus]RCW63148.1 radical SAM family protein [Saliterribacillus persicus]
MPDFKNIVSKTILTPARGCVAYHDFTFSLNPYTGCVFACKYCYVREMPQAKFRGEEWGSYVDIKSNASVLVNNEIKKARGKGQRISIFMSTATDPYQWKESKERITEAILESMLPILDDIDFLMIHTRSPLVKRDIELFKKFGDKILVSMTIETDSEKYRKIFTPSAPPIAARLKALKEITEAGIPTRISISPMLPMTKKVAKIFKEATDTVVLDTYSLCNDGKSDRTEEMGIKKIYENINLPQWYERDAYKKILPILEKEFGQVKTIKDDCNKCSSL